MTLASTVSGATRRYSACDDVTGRSPVAVSTTASCRRSAAFNCRNAPVRAAAPRARRAKRNASTTWRRLAINAASEPANACGSSAAELARPSGPAITARDPVANATIFRRLIDDFCNRLSLRWCATTLCVGMGDRPALIEIEHVEPRDDVGAAGSHLGT